MRPLLAVLAVTLFSGCVDLERPNGPAGLILRPDHQSAHITVYATDSNADWGELKITASEATMRWRLNGEASVRESDGAIQQGGAFSPVLPRATPIRITDHLDLCGVPRTGAASVNPTVRIVDEAGGLEVFNQPFRLPTCA